jgi:hypothetical protein
MFFGKKLLAAGALFSLTTLNAQATLTINANGLGVYDSGLNATWTQDANLLGTLEANTISQNGNDRSLITAIINASGGVIHDTPNYYDGSYNYYDGNYGLTYSGTYALTAADFGSGGTVDWWAGQAYVHYLDTINYGGSNQWALPTQSDQNGSFNNTNSQFGELFYSELFGVAGGSVPSGPFSNVQSYAYWSGTENAFYPSLACSFYTCNGLYYNYKYTQLYTWAVSPGQLSAVPVPSSVWLFVTSLLGLLGLKRSGDAG